MENNVFPQKKQKTTMYDIAIFTLYCHYVKNIYKSSMYDISFNYHLTHQANYLSGMKKEDLRV